jgi:hypothetical protein
MPMRVVPRPCPCGCHTGAGVVVPLLPLLLLLLLRKMPLKPSAAAPASPRRVAVRVRVVGVGVCSVPLISGGQGRGQRRLRCAARIRAASAGEACWPCRLIDCCLLLLLLVLPVRVLWRRQRGLHLPSVCRIPLALLRAAVAGVDAAFDRPGRAAARVPWVVPACRSCSGSSSLHRVSFVPLSTSRSTHSIAVAAAGGSVVRSCRRAVEAPVRARACGACPHPPGFARLWMVRPL